MAHENKLFSFYQLRGKESTTNEYLMALNVLCIILVFLMQTCNTLLSLSLSLKRLGMQRRV